jgi:hypothetical protein
MRIDSTNFIIDRKTKNGGILSLNVGIDYRSKEFTIEEIKIRHYFTDENFETAKLKSDMLAEAILLIKKELGEKK